MRRGWCCPSPAAGPTRPVRHTLRFHPRRLPRRAGSRHTRPRLRQAAPCSLPPPKRGRRRQRSHKRKKPLSPAPLSAEPKKRDQAPPAASRNFSPNFAPAGPGGAWGGRAPAPLPASARTARPLPPLLRWRRGQAGPCHLPRQGRAGGGARRAGPEVSGG